jgi:hypothetical protein
MGKKAYGVSAGAAEIHLLFEAIVMKCTVEKKSKGKLLLRSNSI